MKKLILNILLFTFLLMLLSTVVVNANLAAFVGNKIVYLDDDPNEPQPEAVFIYCSDEDPNEPQPESMLTNCSIEDPNEPNPEAVFSCSDEDPNEPQPEIALINGLIDCSDEDPNEPQPEST